MMRKERVYVESQLPEAWAQRGDCSTPAPSISSSRTNSPMVGIKTLGRPKSVPATLRSTHHSAGYYSQSGRPSTAGGVGRDGCGRVQQLQFEPTRKHNLETHLRLKKNKQPPWQKNLDQQPVPVFVTPGYTLSRSKSKIEMHIKTDDFFDPPPDEKELEKTGPERDALVAELQQQIDDLCLFLEEERLNHRETKKNAAQLLRDKLEDLNNQHYDQMRLQQDEHQAELEDLTDSHTREMNKHKADTDAIINKRTREVEFLQAAFESFRSQISFEMDGRWKEKEADLKLKFEEDMQEKMNEFRTIVAAEKKHEKADQAREHQREILNIRKEHKKELEVLTRRFANASTSMRKLKEAEIELKEKNKLLEELQAEYDNVCSQLTETTRDLTDTKIRLLGFEHKFQDKVQDIDDKYRQEIHDLMQTNTELRKLLVKKCDELYEEKASNAETQSEQLSSAKEAMKLIIQTRNRARVNLSGTHIDLEETGGRDPKDRPSSAPTTQNETEKLYRSAGETDQYVGKRQQRRRQVTPARPYILQESDSNAEQDMQQREPPAHGSR